MSSASPCTPPRHAGEVITGTTMAAEAAERVEAGGLTWAYRRVAANPAQATVGKLPVLCLHGLGCQSYAYRTTASLLGEAGHEVIAADWPGHGASSKPAPGSGFDYSAEAYTAALSQFVEAVGLGGRPFALMVHGFVLGQYGMLWALDNDGGCCSAAMPSGGPCAVLGKACQAACSGTGPPLLLTRLLRATRHCRRVGRQAGDPQHPPGPQDAAAPRAGGLQKPGPLPAPQGGRRLCRRPVQRGGRALRHGAPRRRRIRRWAVGGLWRLWRAGSADAGRALCAPQRGLSLALNTPPRLPPSRPGSAVRRPRRVCRCGSHHGSAGLPGPAAPRGPGLRGVAAAQPAAVWHLGCAAHAGGRAGGRATRACHARSVEGVGRLPSVLPSDFFFPSCLPGIAQPPADQFIELKSVFDWLESKRTCMKLGATVDAKLGHMPQARGGGRRLPRAGVQCVQPCWERWRGSCRGSCPQAAQAHRCRRGVPSVRFRHLLSPPLPPTASRPAPPPPTTYPPLSQEEYPEAIHKSLVAFLEEDPDLM